MKRIRVEASSKKYDVIVGNSFLDSISSEIKSVTKAKKLMLVTDDNVAPLHLDAVKKQLKNWEVFVKIIPNGEQTKNINTVLEILTELAENRFDRNDVVIALGGGVVGDISAFSASIYMRGIGFINIPTTLLSQVDSSVGGKTGVDFRGAKNIVGTFYQPSLVICDTAFLNTLPANIFADGCAEVIKYAFINDKPLLDVIDRGIRENIEEIVCRCVENKRDIINEDEFDRGNRALLNFGHTVAHAVEAKSDYKTSHGSAVAIGMAVMTKACENAGICGDGVYDRLISVLIKNNLPTKTDFSADEMIDVIKSDKKKSGDSISVIVPRRLCSCEIEKMSFEKLHSLLKGVLA